MSTGERGGIVHWSIPKTRKGHVFGTLGTSGCEFRSIVSVICFLQNADPRLKKPKTRPWCLRLLSNWELEFVFLLGGMVKLRWCDHICDSQKGLYSQIFPILDIQGRFCYCFNIFLGGVHRWRFDRIYQIQRNESSMNPTDSLNQIDIHKKTSSRWLKVPFSSPSWRSLNPLQGSLNHPKKVTLNHQDLEMRQFFPKLDVAVWF